MPNSAPEAVQSLHQQLVALHRVRRHLEQVIVTGRMEEMAEAGYWRIGLAGDAEPTLGEALPAGPVALVLGAEGPGEHVGGEGEPVMGRPNRLDQFRTREADELAWV